MLKKLFFLPSEFSKLLHFSIIPLLGFSSPILNRCRSGIFNPCISFSQSPINYVKHLICIRRDGVSALFSPKPTTCSGSNREVHQNGLGIGSSVISRCSHLWEKKPGDFPENCSPLQEILKQYGDLGPEVFRRFWRVSVL
ncbi:hypothetical protein HPP92_012727 [Vanilla planifolia]|uniref:Uncharacterized protein n=1 Tax=Vanilla planifolia TaxID=51239 RepID=A0A835UXY6_VANPL|nr:hypothetical protein HPP92_012727 [Vanilla planifolia]